MWRRSPSNPTPPPCGDSLYQIPREPRTIARDPASSGPASTKLQGVRSTRSPCKIAHLRWLTPTVHRGLFWSCESRLGSCYTELELPGLASRSSTLWLPGTERCLGLWCSGINPQRVQRNCVHFVHLLLTDVFFESTNHSDSNGVHLSFSYCWRTSAKTHYSVFSGEDMAGIRGL